MAEVELVDVHEVARITGVSESQLVKLRLYNPDQSPPFCRIGRRVLYPLSGEKGLQKWIANRTVGGAMQQGGAR